MYDISTIQERSFIEMDMPDFFSEKGCLCAGRLTAQDMANMPDITKDIGTLRRRLSELFALRLNSNYSRLEAECDIKRNTFQKMLRNGNGRNITYPMLAKFCVGAQLSMSEAIDLFLMMGYELSENNRYDYILLCELKNGGDIVEFDKDLKENGCSGILSVEDNVSSTTW